MSTTTTKPEARKRIKLVKFEKPGADVVEKLVSEGKVRKVEIPAKPEHTTEKGKLRKAQPARTEFLAENRASTLALFGGSEKAMNLCACLYREAYIKRMDSKGKVADPDRAINRAAENLGKIDLSGYPAEIREQIEAATAALAAHAAKNPVAPVKRKAKADKTATA